jgi:hypothetical protein
MASRLTDLMLGEVETSESGSSRRFVAMQQYVGHRRHTDSGKPFAWRVYRFTALNNMSAFLDLERIVATRLCMGCGLRGESPSGRATARW